jgi:sugar phosphate permease
LCQPLAVTASAPFTGWLLGAYGWQQMLVLEGILPVIWLPLWWFCICDHPREAKWISAEEREHLETTLQREQMELESPGKVSLGTRLFQPAIFVMIALYFLHNCAVYGCMTFFTTGLKGRGFSAMQYGLLFAAPYALTAVIMIVVSWHSDKTQERRGHVAAVYAMSGISLILSVVFRQDFWLSYAFMCLAIPGPYAGMAPFWAIPGETLPRNAMGLVMGTVNAFGNLGGFAGPYIIGALSKEYHSTAIGFTVIGVGMLGCTALAFLLPKAKEQITMTGRSAA